MEKDPGFGPSAGRIIGIGSYCFLASLAEPENGFAIYWMWIAADPILCWFSIAVVSRMLGDERRSGMLETVLVTPISGSVIADAVHRAWVEQSRALVRFSNRILAVFPIRILVDLLIGRREEVPPVLILPTTNLLFANRIRSRHLRAITARDGLHRTGAGFASDMVMFGKYHGVLVILLCVAFALRQCLFLAKRGQEAHRKLCRIRNEARRLPFP